MDVRTPALILLSGLLAALALSVLGLAADNVAYVNNHHDSTVDLHYLRWNSTAQSPYSYWVQIDYMPSRFSMSRINAMLAASVISLLVGVAVAVASWKARTVKTAAAETDSTSTVNTLPLDHRVYDADLWYQTSKRSTMLPLASLVLASVAFVISLAVAIYAWYPVMQWDINFKKSLPLPPSITGSKSKAVQYQSPFALGPDLWNCWISDYTVDPAMGGRLRTLCREAEVTKDLMIPVVLLAAALVVTTGLSWWTASRAAASKPETNEKEMDEVSI